MSTRSGKPGNPINLSAYEPQRARERVAAVPHPSEGKTDPLRSPYAPKRAHEPAGKARHPLENDRDPLHAPYAPAAERHTLGGGDHSPKTALEEGITAGHPVDRDAAASFQPAHPSSARHQPPAAERRDEIMSDHDLERLEASLRWLQRQEAATRLPRATHLPPVPGLAPVDATGPRHSSEMLVDSFRAPRSLEPERLTSPLAVRSRRDNRRWPLAVVLTGIIAVPIVYYFPVGSSKSPPELGSQIESLDQRSVRHSRKAHRSTARPAPKTMIMGRRPMEMSADRTGISQTARSSEGETVGMLQGRGIGAQAPSTGKANRALDPEEIKLLTRQGEQFAAAGDLVTARILFQRAAEAGDASAAIMLGATYDPNVLAKLGVVGMNADVEKARGWYRKAESFGSPDASQRLNALANR